MQAFSANFWTLYKIEPTRKLNTPFTLAATCFTSVQMLYFQIQANKLKWVIQFHAFNLLFVLKFTENDCVIRKLINVLCFQVIHKKLGPKSPREAVHLTCKHGKQSMWSGAQWSFFYCEKTKIHISDLTNVFSEFCKNIKNLIKIWKIYM